MKVIKRSGEEVAFNAEKIRIAITKANGSIPKEQRMLPEMIDAVTAIVTRQCAELGHTPAIEEIQDMVELALMRCGGHEVARHYVKYRYNRTIARQSNTIDDAVLAIVELANEEAKQENSNKNPVINSTQRDYIAGEVSKDLTRRILLPADIVAAHEAGIIHFHDADYFAQREHNCCLVNLADMLQNGTVITGTLITKPKSFATACNIATQVVAQVASNQYGGQSFSLAHLAPFVDVSRQKIKAKVKEELKAHAGLEGEALEKAAAEIAEDRLKDEIKAGIQTIQYQLVTLMTTNGQTPFVTMYMYLDEAAEGRTRDDMALLVAEVLRQRIKGLPDETGAWITPAFPKLIYVLDEDNVREGSRYWELTKLAAQCTAKRMVPDYISAKVQRELKGEVYTCMGCRSFLTVEDGIRNPDGSHKLYGRFNQGVVTINLPYIACMSGGDMDRFWELLDEYLELCHQALQYRHKRLLGTPSDVAPILWQHGALARLKKGETIDKLLFGGYSTISLGYAGLYEMCVRMTGKSHTDPEAMPFAMAVMQRLNDSCKKWREAENIAYSVYGTPLESTTYKFAKALQRDFGIIKDVSDHTYITNSYHICVRENIDAFSKLKFEAEFQKLSPGGAISYVEVPNMQNNIPAIIAVMQHIYETIVYAEINTKSDHCDACGYDGEIQIVDDGDGKLVWECPHCGCRDQARLHVARRTCGYIGTNFWNQGRTAEIKDRVLHL